MTSSPAATVAASRTALSISCPHVVALQKLIMGAPARHGTSHVLCSMAGLHGMVLHATTGLQHALAEHPRQMVVNSHTTDPNPPSGDVHQARTWLRSSHHAAARRAHLLRGTRG